MMKDVVWYPEAWYKVEFDIMNVDINFKAWKIYGLDEECLSNSDVEDVPSIEGSITWDGKIRFNQDGDYTHGEAAQQTCLLMKKLSIYGEQNWEKHSR